MGLLGFSSVIRIIRVSRIIRAMNVYVNVIRVTRSYVVMRSAYTHSLTHIQKALRMVEKRLMYALGSLLRQYEMLENKRYGNCGSIWESRDNI